MSTTSPSKIAVVIDSINQGGGAEKNAIRLAESLLQSEGAGFLVTFYTYSNEYVYSGPRISFAEEPALTIDTKISKFFRRLRAIDKLVRDSHITHVVTFLEVANFSVLCTKLLFRTPCKLIVSVRADPRRVSWLRRQIIRYGYRYADIVVAVSRDMKRILEVDFGLTNVVAIPNPIDIEQVQKEMQKPLPSDYHFLTELPENAKVFINVGRLVDQKAQDVLIRAFAKVHIQNPNTYLLIIGEGPKRAELEQLITSLGLSGHAFLLGQQSNIYPILRVANCFVLTSKYEGFPNVLLEAAAANLYIISTDCPTGPREIIAPDTVSESVNYPLRVPGASLLPNFADTTQTEAECVLCDEMLWFCKKKIDQLHILSVSSFSPKNHLKNWQAILNLSS